MIASEPWRKVKLDGMARALIVQLAVRQFPLGYCEIAQKELASELDCSIDRLSRALRDAVASGFVEIMSSQNGLPLRYIVNMPEGKVAPRAQTDDLPLTAAPLPLRAGGRALATSRSQRHHLPLTAAPLPPTAAPPTAHSGRVDGRYNVPCAGSLEFQKKTTTCEVGGGFFEINGEDGVGEADERTLTSPNAKLAGAVTSGALALPSEKASPSLSKSLGEATIISETRLADMVSPRAELQDADERESLRRTMVEDIKVTPKKADSLLKKFPVAQIRRQVANWPKRDRSTYRNRVGAFVTSVEQDWEMPSPPKSKMYGPTTAIVG